MKALLQRAAASSHKNVTEFLLEAGINAAEDALVDRRIFSGSTIASGRPSRLSSTARSLTSPA